MAGKKTNKKEKKDNAGLRESKDSKKDTNYNKILKNFLIVIGIVIIAAITFFLFTRGGETFNYRGVNFTVVKFCDAGPFSCITTYNTKIPVTYQEEKANYNFYLRNDPRELGKEVSFDGEYILKKNMLLGITFNTYCRGYETIAVENFLNLHRIMGVNISSGENATCNSIEEGNIYILIQESDETRVEKIGPACYNINIKGCEILEGTERFMIETFVELNRII